MLFNSAEFLLFLPIAFAVYWLLRNTRRLQNLWVVAASWFFYACWDWRFLGLIALTSVVSWLSGLGGLKVKVASVAINIAILGLFKYYDFFAAGLAALLGLASDRVLLHLVLPVGISFYTFQAIGYTIDVYKRRIEPTRDLVAYLAYVSFFPQLVAGPIERATNLLPQFLAPRRFDYHQAVDGLRQMLWGYFLKMAVPTVAPCMSTPHGPTTLPAQEDSCFWLRYSLPCRSTATLRATAT